MPVTAYAFEARNSEGALVTGLTPTVAAIKRESDNTNITGLTFTFTETCPGFYKFYYDPIVSGEAFIQVDLGVIVGTANRFVNLQLTTDTTPNLLASLIDTGLTLRQTLKGVAAVLFGNAISTATTIEYKAQDGSTTVVTGAAFDGTGGRTITKNNL